MYNNKSVVFVLYQQPMIQKAYSDIFYARIKDKFDFNRPIVLFVWRRKSSIHTGGDVSGYCLSLAFGTDSDTSAAVKFHVTTKGHHVGNGKIFILILPSFHTVPNAIDQIIVQLLYFVKHNLT